ncbi:MAG: formate dehydrogenase accessory sulfurtransferase FdhD, partial [Nevskiaceae bacterium]|nr:formate dehydrogenase accessory sulfurtransferase FdhD [Nevskiaceae bacterium]
MSSPEPAVVELPVRRWRSGVWSAATDRVASEAPVALTYNSIPHVVMLATPSDLLDLGVGFTVSEALVDAPSQVREARLEHSPAGPVVALSIAQHQLTQVLQRRRNLTGRTGCGVCGAETIEDAIRRPPPVAAGGVIARQGLEQALRTLHSWQVLNAGTGSLHAAAWVGWDGAIHLVREDVGRHHALDKLIGAHLRAGADLQQGFVLVTSRASYEMVQKAATVGVRMLVAVSAPTALAVELASATGL